MTETSTPDPDGESAGLYLSGFTSIACALARLMSMFIQQQMCQPAGTSAGTPACVITANYLTFLFEQFNQFRIGETGLNPLLEGKRAFISGGTRGIGAALCEVF